MYKVYLTCRMYGENFLPQKIEENIKIKFTRKHEKGTYDIKGRFKNTPYSYSVASLEAPIEWQAREDLMGINKFLEYIRPFVNEAKKYGVETIDLYIDIYYSEQCNFELSLEEIKTLSDLEIGFALSCYKVE